MTQVKLSSRSSAPYDTRPALLNSSPAPCREPTAARRCARCHASTSSFGARPAARIGVVATLRDVLPGRYWYKPSPGVIRPGRCFRRAPTRCGSSLPTEAGPSAVRTVSFAIKSAQRAEKHLICEEKRARDDPRSPRLGVSRENPYQIAKAQLGKVAQAFAIDPNLVNVLQECKKSVAVSVPVCDGQQLKQRVFKGYRVSTTSRGALQGRHSIPPGVTLDEVKALAMWMTWKCALARHSVRRREGRHRLRSEAAVEGPAGAHDAAVHDREIVAEIGPEKDIPAPDVGTDGAVTAGHHRHVLDELGLLGVRRRHGACRIGGSQGRQEATARGALYCVREAVAQERQMSLRGTSRRRAGVRKRRLLSRSVPRPKTARR